MISQSKTFMCLMPSQQCQITEDETDNKHQAVTKQLPRYLLEMNATQQQCKRHVVLVEHSSRHSIVCHLQMDNSPNRYNAIIYSP